jgi:hypothetical protein
MRGGGGGFFFFLVFGFCAALLSGRWDNAQADGLYFIDAGPELFKHLVRYLRRSVLPIFYDNLVGHSEAQVAENRTTSDVEKNRILQNDDGAKNISGS